MTLTLQVFRTLALAAPALLYAASAAPQSANHPKGHSHQDAVATIGSGDTTATESVKEQIAALDRRIQMLATDMRMFSGDMKIDAMASLLSTIIERQSLLESEMKSMREGMMRRMAQRRESPAASVDFEPGSMCVPAN